MIEAHDLTKRYGKTTAVDHLSFTVEPGTVTGFLGPNGAGKTTTMRMILGLDRPTSGTVTVCGREYSSLSSPMTTVGALLDARGMHGGRNARNHLKQLAATHSIPRKRVDEVLELTGLTAVAKKNVKSFSLGMTQRLGIAAALLGDPQVLLFDEPVNGLDPEGVRWVRDMCKGLAASGKTVFISSHLMSEMAQTADHLLVIGQGRLIAQGSVDDVIRMSTTQRVHIVSPMMDRLLPLLETAGARILENTDSSVTVQDLTNQHIGEIAAQHHLVIHELTPLQASLEEAYMQLTNDSVEYRGGAQ
ncbi:ABC transporter ATP-binding protein [Actinomyces vulturis]|uniref:ABC transporter ATP-binding protein n=1 Tax=Actinomyces vulturis TaxID=1857645 RepID=UPI0008324140|nr:ABC transporter ATP-binding protein [Actinomyces vulturis]